MYKKFISEDDQYRCYFCKNIDVYLFAWNICFQFTQMYMKRLHIDGLMQQRRNSSAIAMEKCLSCIIPSIFWLANNYTEHFFSWRFIFVLNVKDFPHIWQRNTPAEWLATWRDKFHTLTSEPQTSQGFLVPASVCSAMWYFRFFLCW